jgi:hypothetical protein
MSIFVKVMLWINRLLIINTNIDREMLRCLKSYYNHRYYNLSLKNEMILELYELSTDSIVLIELLTTVELYNNFLSYCITPANDCKDYKLNITITTKKLFRR